LAHTHNNLGLLLHGLGQRQDALQEFRQARAIGLELAKAHPELPEQQNDLADTHNNLAMLLVARGQREEALKEYAQARAIGVRLTKAHPEVPRYRIGLAATCCNLGHLLRDGGKARESLTPFAQAIQQLRTVCQRDPQDARARLFLRNSHWGRAQALGVLGTHGEAAADWDQAVRLDAGPARPFLRLRRADSRARAGDYQRAAAEADELGRGNPPGPALYDLGCIQALSAAGVARDASRPLPIREKRAEDYARAAVALLQRAASAGFFRTAANVAHLDKDSDLAFLRGRADYKTFRAGLKPAK
jgi:tetratricopeptide (TPR) repeat protein